MLLVHKCPICGSEHEMASTPEPDQPCPKCRNNHVQSKHKIKVYELYDLVGKVRETRDYQEAVKWKNSGETRLFHDRKRRYFKREK
jgi:hypothetical protein